MTDQPKPAAAAKLAATPKPVANQKGVLYLERSRLQMYSMAKPAVLIFEIPPAIAHDIEIFNQNEFEKQLLNFIKTNALPSTDYVMVLAQNVLFEKEFSPPNPDEQKKFIDSVPFEYVSTKEFPSVNSVRVVATNSEFHKGIEDVLSLAGSTVEAVIPYFSVNPQMNGLDQGTMAVILGQRNLLKQSSLTATKSPELVITNPEADRKAEEKKKNNKTLIYSIPAFVLLFGVLGFMLLRPNSEPVTKTTKSAVRPTEVATIVPSQTASPSAALQPTLDKNSATIQITYDTAQAQQALGLKNRLAQAGYVKTALADGGAISSPKPLMTIPEALAQNLKADIQSIVREVFPEIAVQESKESTTIIITIGK